MKKKTNTENLSRVLRELFSSSSSHTSSLSDVLLTESLNESHFGKFDMNTFKRLKTPTERNWYALSNLKKLGEGSSRIAYALSTNSVLKVVRPISKEKGILQNEAEVDIWTNPKTKAVAARIFDFDMSGYTWLVMETAQEFKKSIDLSKALNLPNRTTLELIIGFFTSEGQTPEAAVDAYIEFSYDMRNMTDKRIAALRDYVSNPPPFILALADLIKDNKLGKGDIVYEHFGKTASGKIVLFDYGYTSKVANFYNHAPNSEYSSDSQSDSEQPNQVSSLRENAYADLGATDEKYYHCTPSKNVPQIMKRGLFPGDGETFGNYDWSEGKVFVSRGYAQAKSWQEVIADLTKEDIAILELELSPFQIKHLYPDEYAQEQDGNEDSFYMLDSIPPNQIKVVTGNGSLKEEHDYRIYHTAPGKEASSPLWNVAQESYPEDIYTLPVHTAAQYYGASEPDDVGVMSLIRKYKNKPKAKVKIYRAVSSEPTIEQQILNYEVKKAKYMRRNTIPDPGTLERDEAAAARAGGSKYYDWLWDRVEKLKKQLATSGEPERLDITGFNPGDWVTIWRPYAVEHGEGNLNGKYKILTKVVTADTLYTDGNSLYEWGYNP